MRLLNLSNLPWVPGRLKRNQAVFLHLLKADPTFSGAVFVNPPVIAPALGRKYYSAPSLLTIATTSVGSTVVHIVQPVYSLPYWHSDLLTRRWGQEIVSELIRKYLDGHEYMLWMNSAGKLQTAMSRLLAPRAKLRVFDSSDDFTSWERPGFQRQLDEIVGLADMVTCVNDHVAATIEHSRKIVFRNCTDFDTFQKVNPDYRLAPYYPKDSGSVYVGFIGGVQACRADLGLLEYLFRRFPAFQFLFVGYTDDRGFVNRLVQHQNAAYLEEVSYRDLPNVIRGFDIAIVPHVDNAVTRGNDLLKVLDYLACGVPAVSTACSGVEDYSGALYIAHSAEEFGDYVERLTSGTLHHNPEPGIRIAQERTWDKQVPGLASLAFDTSLSVRVR